MAPARQAAAMIIAVLASPTNASSVPPTNLLAADARMYVAPTSADACPERSAAPNDRKNGMQNAPHRRYIADAILKAAGVNPSDITTIAPAWAASAIINGNSRPKRSPITLAMREPSEPAINPYSIDLTRNHSFNPAAAPI